jgi:hypothetical protein
VLEQFMEVKSWANIQKSSRFIWLITMIHSPTTYTNT